MSNVLVQKIEELRVVGVRLFDLLDDLELSRQPNVHRLPIRRSDFALAQVARTLLAQRRDRLKNFPSELFSEPAWDILLDLYVMKVDQKSVSISSACLATCVPATTAIRWLDILEKLGLIVRKPSQEDRRRCDVELTSAGASAVGRYLNDCINANWPDCQIDVAEQALDSEGTALQIAN